MTERDSKWSASRPRLTPGLVLWGVLAISALVLLAQNSTDTTVQFFWFDVTAPLFVVIGAALLIGWGLGELGSKIWSRRRRRQSDH